MDEIGFRKFLKKAGKKEQVIDGLVNQVRAFERDLRDRQAASLESANEHNLLAYLDDLGPDRARVQVRGVMLYMKFAGRDDLARFASTRREAGIAGRRKQYRLREFRGVKAEDTDRLAATGVLTCTDMLDTGSTPEARRQLAERTGVTPGVVLELVKLADLSRLEGVKGTRARLYVDAGLDTLDKLAAHEPAELRAMLVEWVARTGFDGIAPLPKELENTVAAARRLARIVEY